MTDCADYGWSVCSGLITALVLGLFLYWIAVGQNQVATLNAISIAKP